MSFEIIRNDITRVKADAIVNTANENPVYGAGTDAAIYHAAGEEKLLEARRKIGRLNPGDSAVTPAFDLKAKYIIHTVSPLWQGGKHGEEEILKKCYSGALQKAEELECKSIAFPLISSGSFGYPKDLALQTALSVLQSYAMSHKMKIYLVVFDGKSFELSGQIYETIQAFVDDHYVAEQHAKEYHHSPNLRGRTAAYYDDHKAESAVTESPEFDWTHLKDPVKSGEFSKILKESHELTFQEKMFEYLDKKGLKPSHIYGKAHLSKALFSKINADKFYQPTKRTALAFCVALKLTFDEAKDLLERAGLSFSKSNKADIIIAACLVNQKYDFQDIDLLLIKNGCETLRKYE